MPWKRVMTTVATRAQQTRLQPRRVVLCADFDQTLTTRDTIALLFQSAANRQKSAQAKEEHATQVQRLVKQYASEMSGFVTNYHYKRKQLSGGIARMQTVAETTTAGQPAHTSVGAHHGGRENSDPFFDAAGLSAFLDGYGAVDLQSIRRVIDLNVLHGIHEQDLVDSAKQIELMDKCVDVLASADAAYVISSNWSAAMLDAALHSGNSRAKIKIITNNLELDADGVTTGKIEMRVQSPSDKAQWVRQIRMNEKELKSTGGHHQQQYQQQSEPPLIVFVGDSANDLLAMVEADVGISLITDADSSFVKLADRFGVQMEPIANKKSLLECARASKEASLQDRQVLFTANEWGEIGDAIAFNQRG